MFKKVYPMSKKPVDFRDNPFRLVEVSKNGSFPKKAGFKYDEDDFEDLMDEDLEVSTNPIYGNAGYDDEDEDDFVSAGYSNEDDEDDDNFGGSASNNDDDDYQSFGSMDAASTDWGAVDFAAVDWGNY